MPRPRASASATGTSWPWLLAGGAAAGALLAAAARASGAAAPGRLPGTLFTIVFENHDRSQVLGSGQAPTFDALAARYANATGYRSAVHPSLPNYILMTSGATAGITDDRGHIIPGDANLAAQLDAARIPWRAYAQGARVGCDFVDHGRYAPRHVPFLYYQYVRRDAAYCANRVVPLDPALWDDLAADRVKYAWITPDLCNDAHDCAIGVGDAWLAAVMPRLLASPGYRRGGAIFLLFDEGLRGTGLATVVVSERLRRKPVVDATVYDQRSYLATVEDLLGLPRLPATTGVPSMAPLFF